MVRAQDKMGQLKMSVYRMIAMLESVRKISYISNNKTLGIDCASVKGSKLSKSGSHLLVHR
jgi:hypothetical protein